MATTSGVGFLIVNNILTDCAFSLFQASVNQAVPLGGILTGVQTVAVWDKAMYLGAQLVVGLVNGNIEVVTITAINPGVSFAATFATSHSAGEPILGATFPVRQTTDPLFTQPEMLAYLSTAVNDFLLDCPLVYAITELAVAPTEQNTDLPSDCMFPVRVAYNNYPLRETSQSNLDSLMYGWSQAAMTTPQSYFRDKVPFQNVGIWPRQGNTTNLELVYTQRQTSSTLQLADGFLLPDPFLLFVFHKTLSYAFSKDGECRNPGLARYFQQRYEWGVQISKMFLESISDPNLEMAQ